MNTEPDHDSTITDDTTQLLQLSLAAAPLRVLVVDDDPIIRERLSLLVEAAGFDACTASTGAQALHILRTDFCSVLMTDWLMPDMDGLALCLAVRAESFPGYLYILLLTARDQQQDMLAGFDAGADDFLSKRVTEAEITARLRTARRIITLERSLRSMLDEKRKLSTTDALTGAHNRRYLMKHLSREVKRVQRYGGSIAALMLDIDHFKHVNDRYGHKVGDEVLREFAARLQRGLSRECDWFARSGGEEFVVVLPGAEPQGASVVAEKLRTLIAAQPFRTSSGPLGVTVSIGVATLAHRVGQQGIAGSSAASPTIDSIDALLESADRALYDSKKNGRDRVTLATARSTASNTIRSGRP